MSASSYNDLIARLKAPTQSVPFIKGASLVTGTHWNSEWNQAGFPGVGSVPTTTGVIPDNTTVGSLGQNNKVGTEQRAYLRRFSDAGGATVTGGVLMLVDRLAHAGGLVANVATLQAFTLPALTRFTSGDNLWAGLEIYTSIGSTATTAVLAYTNTASVAKNSQPIPFGGTGFATARSVFPVSLASGDTGLIGASGVTVAITTGTAGVFGVTIFKTLGMWPVNGTLPFANAANPMSTMFPMPAVPDNACLQLLHFGAGQVSTFLTAEICFFED